MIIALGALTMQIHAQVTGSFTDHRDGKVYKTVEIGTQIWMSENLAFKAASGCWAYNKDLKNVALYGYLYNYASALKACPIGWHTANDVDWKNLANYLGGENNAGAKMKTTSGWTNNTNHTNSSGFNGLPGGYYQKSDGKFKSMGNLAAMWTATMSEDDLGMTVWSYMLGSNNLKLVRDHVVFTEEDGLSVRCVKEGFIKREVKEAAVAAFPKGCKVRLVKDESPFDLLNSISDEKNGVPTVGTVIEDLVPLGDGWYSGMVNMNNGGYRNYKRAKFELVK
jgi:uncharacterized protein (TIGR02145 family)